MTLRLNGICVQILDVTTAFPATEVTTVSNTSDRNWGIPDVASSVSASMVEVSTLICFVMGIIH